MVRQTIRIPEELADKLRWLSFKTRKSQNDILIEALAKALEDVKVPKEEQE